ncbi:MAG: hypothetical protein QM486_04675 [Flavobacteriaceae bacterium]
MLSLFILLQISFNLVFAQQDSHIKDKIIGNWYYFADVNKNSNFKDYNEIYFDGNKVQECLEAVGVVHGVKYKIEGDILKIDKKDTIFSYKVESIYLNQFTLIQNGIKRTFYKVKSRTTLDKVLNNKISDKYYSKAFARRMFKAKKRFNITTPKNYYKKH